MLKVIRLQAVHASMDQAEIETIMDAVTIAEIKKTDSNPMIKAYSVGHEGIADGSFKAEKGESYVKSAMLYMKGLIYEIAAKMKPKTPVFFQHSTKANEKRIQVGQVVGTGVIEKEGKEHAVAAVHILPAHIDDHLDIASIETNLTAVEDPSGQGYIATGIDSIPALTISSSKIDAPGFEGATMWGMFRALQTTEEDTMTQEQILKAIADGKFTLTTLFGKETLLADADVVAAIAEKTQAYQTAADSAQRMATERDTASTAKIAELETQIGTLTGNLTKATLKDTLAEVIGDTKLPANRQKFIDTQLTGLDIKGTTPEAIKAELQTWYTGQQTVMDSYGLPTEDAPVVPGDPNTITPPIKTPVVAPPGKTPVNDGLPPELSPTGNDLVSPEFAAVSQQIAGAGLAIKE